MRRPSTARVRWAAGVTAVLFAVAASVFWPHADHPSAGTAAAPAGSAPADARAVLLSAGRREIAEVSGRAAADGSGRLDDTTGALHQALAGETTAPGGGAAAPGTVTAVATTAFDTDAGTADLIATMRSSTAGEQRLSATMAVVDGAWKLAALSVVPVGAAPVAVPPGTGAASDVGDALDRILSYSPGTAAAAARAAEQVLTGTAADQYRQLFGGISDQVRQQGLTVDSRVVRIGVEQQTADRAQLLVFVDQTARRTGGAATRVGAQLTVTARLSGGHWRIVALASG